MPKFVLIRRRAGIVRFIGVLAAAVALLSACAVPPPGAPQAPAAPPVPSGPPRITFTAPIAWGGEARCMADGCKLALVEHENGRLVLHQFKGRTPVELDRQPLAYHPDSAKWLNDHWVVAAVEDGQSLDFFQVEGGKLIKRAQAKVPFAPRDVVLLDQEGDRYTLMATPYSGASVALVHWSLGATDAQTTPVPWCRAPWHPAVVKRAPNARGKGAVVACLDDKKLMYLGAADNWTGDAAQLASFDVVARQARPSPSGKWVYVALELGPRNARVNMDSGEVQYLDAPLGGTVSVAPVDDDLAIWGEPSALYLQRYDAQGKVLAPRRLPASGFPTELQLIDLDGDGELDLLVLNSAGERADVFYGPLWDKALENQ